MEGKTPDITVPQARTLLTSFKTSHAAGLRDRAIIAILIYTADREKYMVKHRVQYPDAAGLRDSPAGTVLLRSAIRKTGKLTERAMHANDLCQMVKRRLRDAGLPSRLSPHSFRVMTITDLLEQSVPLEDVQRLAGHADPRTTRLYDRRQKKITRNIVERISI